MQPNLSCNNKEEALSCLFYKVINRYGYFLCIFNKICELNTEPKCKDVRYFIFIIQVNMHDDCVIDHWVMPNITYTCIPSLKI